MANNITRTINTCKAYGLFATIKEDGTAEVTKTDSVEFITTLPVDDLKAKALRAEGMRALRDCGIKVNSKDVRITVVESAVYAMTFETFMQHAKKVERAKGGYVKASDLADED